MVDIEVWPQKETMEKEAYAEVEHIRFKLELCGVKGKLKETVNLYRKGRVFASFWTEDVKAIVILH